MECGSLFSGFIGALVGAGIMGVVAFLTTKWQVKNTIEQQVNWERERIIRREAVRRRA